MQRKFFGIITIFLFAALFFIQYGFLRHYDLSYDIDKYYFAIDIISLVLTIITISIVLSLIIALIPFGEKSFKTKFKQVFQISTILVLLIAVASYGFLASKGVRQPTIVSYDAVETSSTNECLIVTKGYFETESTVIERLENLQIETSKESGKKIEYDVKWLSSCEYHLTPKINDYKTIKVKITRVEPGFYECATAVENATYRSKVLIKKVN